MLGVFKDKKLIVDLRAFKLITKASIEALSLHVLCIWYLVNY